MKQPPYSLQEAENICKEYQYLSGTSFAPGINAPIQCVAVAPFSQSGKDRFIMYYFLLNDAVEALRQEYNGLLYDVMILACSEDQKLLHENIQSWLVKNKQATVINTTAANAVLNTATNI